MIDSLEVKVGYLGFALVPTAFASIGDDCRAPGVQHRIVDMFIAHQEALSLMQHLSLSPGAGDPGISRLASRAKSKNGYAGRFIADQAVQLHSGVGMSDELNVGHYFKRISSINIQFGDPAYHVLRYAQLDAAA